MSSSGTRTTQRIVVLLATVLPTVLGMLGIFGLHGALEPALREAVGRAAATPLAILAVGLATAAVAASIAHLADRLEKWLGLED